MKTFGVPNWMVAPFVTNGFSESDDYLYGAGRALGFVRMAACTLDEPYSSQEEGEYHAYTGISAARTAIDAIAVWCNLVLELGLKPGIQVSLTKRAFRNKVLKASPGVATYVQALANLAGEIDKHRQRAQHRDGLAIRYKFSRNSKHLTGWYLAPEGLSGDHTLLAPRFFFPLGGWYLAPLGLSGNHTADLRLVDLLNRWADEIEESLREIHKILVMASGDMQEAEQLISWLSKLKSST